MEVAIWTACFPLPVLLATMPAEAKAKYEGVNKNFAPLPWSIRPLPIRTMKARKFKGRRDLSSRQCKTLCIYCNKAYSVTRHLHW